MRDTDGITSVWVQKAYLLSIYLGTIMPSDRQ